MSNSATKTMLAAFIKQAAPTMFLSEMFQSPARNFHNTEEVEIDIMRNDEDISVVITDVSTGYRMNSEDIYTNKAFKPAIHKEAAPLNAFSLLKREVGQDPFRSSTFQSKAMARALRIFRKMEAKIRRSIELQASQVLQTGIVDLKDENGVTIYTIDFKPKATHFPTAGTAWNAGGADIAGDLKSLSEVIRNDGLSNPDELIMGCNAFEAFIKDDEIQKRFDNRRINLGGISPMRRNNNGGIFRGVVEIGNYKFDIWTYGGRFKDAAGVKAQYVDPAKVIMRDSSARLDATFGAIPRFVAPDSRVMPFLPTRVRNVGAGSDMFTNAWLSDDGEQLFVGVGSRPLLIPTDIDSYGCIATGV